MATVESWLFKLITFLLVFHHSHSFKAFTCPESTGKNSAPKLPQSFSTNIRINYINEEYTVEVKYATNGKDGKELFEFIRQDRHVKYITRKDHGATLFIQYKEDERPTCKTIKSTDTKDYLEKEDAGENRIILKAVEVMMYPDMFSLYGLEPFTDTGVYGQRYEACLSDPKINVSMVFAVETWKESHITKLIKNVRYPEMAVAEIGNVFITALFSYFDPTIPDDSVFQPPEDSYCEGFRTDKTPPNLPDYFSYNAEVIVYENDMAVAPIVSQRKVFYDYSSGISRMDFEDPLAEDADMFSEITAKDKSIIHDYNAGVQYIFDPFSGKCTIDTFKATFNAVSFEVREDNKMLNATEYFWYNIKGTTYNGQYPIRGLTADVYTALKVDPATKKSFIVSWYFSTADTRIVESEYVEKNVLLRMYVRPETGMSKEGSVEINFYNFVSELPNALTYDLTSCYNDSSSKLLRFTFPAVDSLRGLEKLVGLRIHSAITDVTGVRKQRVYMKEVVFRGGYMYAEFSLLDVLPVKGKALDKEISLDDAVKKLQDSVSANKFTVQVNKEKEAITLNPGPEGLKVFTSERDKTPSYTGYKEGSVIGLTIGMLILGFILGGVTLNLVMSRKFGVSLLQKSIQKNSGMGNPLYESNM